MYRFYFGIFGVVASLSFISRADPVSNGFFKNVRYVCPSDQLAFMDEPFWEKSERTPITAERKARFLRSMQIYFETIVSTGIERLEKVNPKLSEKVVTAFQKEKLVVSCQSAKHSPVAEFRGKDLFHRNEMHMGSSAWSVYSLSGKGELTEKDVVGLLKDRKKNGKGFNPVVVFHEILHFAKLDNQRTNRHNDLEKFGLGFGDDLVYSCASAVFTGQGWFPNEERVQAATRTCETGIGEGERTGFTVMMDAKGNPLPPVAVRR